MLFDHHIHSSYSVLDSSSGVEDIIKTAREIGLGAIAVSDHDAIEGSLMATRLAPKGLIVIPSMEISSADGHIVGLGIREKVERYLPAKETVDRIHKLGGLAIAAHPYDTVRHGVGDLCWKLPFDAIEINGHCLYGNGKAERIAAKHKKPLVGGSDAHSIGEIATICTDVEGKDAKEVLENIKKGRCKVVYRKNLVSLKASILTGKVSRRINRVL